MLDTRQIQGIQPMTRDREILAIARKHSFNPWGAIPRRVAICNEAGQLYRVVTFTDPIDAARFVDHVKAEFGFIDRVGYDAGMDRLIDDFTGQPMPFDCAAFLQLDRVARPLPVLPL